MVENPNNPILNLDVQKMQSWITPAKLMYEGDKGYNQPFKLTNAWNEYTVTAENLCFSARKPDNQIIEVENEPSRFKLADGIWYFKLPDELTQAVGQVKCFFYIKDEDNNIVASTTKFAYNVEAKFSDEEQSISYVSALERLQGIFEQYIENAKNEVNEMDSVSNEYKQKLLDLLANLQKQVDDWVAAKTTEIDADIRERQTALDTLSTNYQNEYNSLVTKWNDQMAAQNIQYAADKKQRDDTYAADKKDRDDTYTADKNSRDTAFAEEQNARTTAFNTAMDGFNTDYQAKLTAALKDITDQRDAKIAQIDQEWTEKKTTLTNEIDTFKTNLLSQLTTVANSVDKLTNTDLPAMEAKADEVQAKVDQLSADLASIDFNSFAKKADTYTKKEVEDLVDAGGKVKGATINGGNVISPNEAGILPLTVPDPDLSGYAKKADTYTKKEVEDLVDAGGKVKGATINGGNVISPNEAGILPLTVPDPDLSGYATKAEVDSKTKATIVTEYNLDTKDKTTTITDINKKWLTDINVIDIITDCLNTLRGRTTLSNPQFNDIRTTGIYAIVDVSESTYQENNIPVHNLGTLVVLSAGVGDNTRTRLTQIYISDKEPAALFYRSVRADGTWTSWQQLALKADINNLQNQINNKANVSDVTSLTNTVNTKADQSTVDTLNTKVDNLPSLIVLTNTEYNNLGESDKNDSSKIYLIKEE